MLRDRWNLSSSIVVTLTMLLAVVTAVPAYPGGVFWSKAASGWESTLIVSGDGAAASQFLVHDCGIGTGTETIAVAPKGAARVNNFGELQCGSALMGVLPVNVTAKIVTRAVHVATGQTLYVPPAPLPLVDTSVTFSARGLSNKDADATFLLAINNGHEGYATLSVYDDAGERIDRQLVLLAAGVNFVPVVKSFAIGSLELRLGTSDGHFAPDGPIWAWATSGPFTNTSAARVVAFE